MKRWIGVALLACATVAHAQSTPAKKELVNKLLALQQSGIDGMARQIAQTPVLPLLQSARRVLQAQVPADKRDAVAKQIDGDAKKFVEDAVPVLREHAVKLLPSTVGAVMEEKFSEDELKQFIAWLESPANRKYQQLWPEMQASLMQKLMAETAPVLDPKLQVLEQKIRTSLGLPPAAASQPAGK